MGDVAGGGRGRSCPCTAPNVPPWAKAFPGQRGEKGNSLAPAAGPPRLLSGHLQIFSSPRNTLLTFVCLQYRVRNGTAEAVADGGFQTRGRGAPCGEDGIYIWEMETGPLTNQQRPLSV